VRRALATAGVVGACLLPGASAAGLAAPEASAVTRAELGPLLPLGPAAPAATWCGTASQVDRTPNAVAGNPVHWVYAVPSDGPDLLGTVASTMQTDAEEVDGWWRGQDPARAPRNDLAQFSCGLQLDVTTIRLAQSGAQLAPLARRFEAVFNGLVAAGLRSTFTKYLVYYDGAVDEPSSNVCGQGGSDSSGFGLAVVYLQACAGVSTAAVAAHELLHTLGAVPRGAPNLCPDSAHTCNDPSDLMHPSLDDQPLATKSLDPGRDDYYGHSGPWADAQDSAWLVRLDGQAPLALTVTGPGTVSSDVPGLQCAQSCSTTWNAGQRLSLVAAPAAGAKLVRWGGACTGAAGCSLTVQAGASVSALFAPAAFRLTVSVAGRGMVRSSRPGVACRPRCSASFPSYTPVTLTAGAAKGWKLRSWSGACRGASRTCLVPMTQAASVRATFVRR